MPCQGLSGLNVCALGLPRPRFLDGRGGEYKAIISRASKIAGESQRTFLVFYAHEGGRLSNTPPLKDLHQEVLKSTGEGPSGCFG